MSSGVTRGEESARRPGFTVRSSQVSPIRSLAETAVRLGGDQLESGVLVDPAGGDQNALGPQRDPAIAAGLRKRDAFGDQPLAQPLSAPGRIDQQQPQLGDVVGVAHQKYRADLRAIDLGDPATLPRGVERGEEFCRDLRDQALRTRNRNRIRGRRARRGSAPPIPCRRDGGRAASRARARRRSPSSRSITAIAPISALAAAARQRRRAWRRLRPARLRSSLANA